jgi:hypothetical protein
VDNPTKTAFFYYSFQPAVSALLLRTKLIYCLLFVNSSETCVFLLLQQKAGKKLVFSSKTRFLSGLQATEADRRYLRVTGPAQARVKWFTYPVAYADSPDFVTLETPGRLDALCWTDNLEKWSCGAIPFASHLTAGHACMGNSFLSYATLPGTRLSSTRRDTTISAPAAPVFQVASPVGSLVKIMPRTDVFRQDPRFSATPGKVSRRPCPGVRPKTVTFPRVVREAFLCKETEPR